MNKHYFIAIMAGGIGSRFWPSSTEATPKQFLDILGVGSSLLQMTFSRCKKLIPAERILIITNARYKDQILDQLPDLPEHNVLCEPSRNNTAPCVAYTALHLQARDKDAVFAVLPSDHVILKEDVFIDHLHKGLAFAAEADRIVTLGISPTRPDTGYGYIALGEKNSSPFYKVNSFKEKPNKETAQTYLDSGNYVWNAGMFIWSVETILNAFKKYSTNILDTLSQNILLYGTNEEQAYINTVYPNTESISVDYAILEKADNVYCLPADIGWSDLGTWASLHAYVDKDDFDNVKLGKQIHAINTSNSLIRASDKKIVVVKGLEDYIIVDEPNALLIYPKSQEQEIKALRSKLNS